MSAAFEGWTAWRPLALAEPFSPGDFTETIDGGQAFRWTHQSDGSWLGLWSTYAARLKLESTGHLQWSAPRSLAEAVPAALKHYLDAGTTAAARVDRLPWRSDPHLEQCIAAFPGLRILNQELGETLLGFLCSATKQIVQIKQMLALVAERHGTSVAQESPELRRLPTWAELATVSESDLRRCLLGFRAGYVHRTARFLAEHPGWLEETGASPYAEAKARLCLLPGVGEKVADCVLLFGANKPEAFPVDVWILKALANRYGLTDWSPKQLTQFGRAHFGPQAGLAQQYLFAWERKVGRPKPTSLAGSAPPRSPRARR